MQSRPNRLVRAKVQLNARKGYDAGEDETSPDSLLTRLEEDIRRLKIEFDIYFNGGSKRPPYDTKGRVETLVKRLGDDRTLNFAQRYRYNSLAARYNSFRDLWRRTMQGREEGRDAISAARAGGKGQVSEEPVSFVCADATKDVETVQKLYKSLVEAKQQCGESTSELSFPRFHRLIASKAEGLKAKLNCERVEFSITVENGHVSFKAKANRT
jgi:hypothetical protein